MDPTMTGIGVAIVLVAVNVAVFVWFYRKKAAASGWRMMCMMTRIGLDPAMATPGDPRTEAMMKEARRRCARCRLEDFCERWLTGKAKGSSAFCPNARTFDALTRAGGRSG
jgi:hypothetical protein